MGPVERFNPLIPVELWAYSPPVGTGRKVGVAGREDGVGIELVVAIVLRLAPESRDCGRRIPVFIVLLNKEPPLSFEIVGDTAEVEAPGRKAACAEGLDTRLRSLSTSLTGEGESSIMSTHPEVSAAGVLFTLVSISALRLAGVGFAARSSAALDRIDADLVVLTGVVAAIGE